MKKYITSTLLYSIIILLLLTSCTGASMLNKVYATALFSENILELPIRGYANLGNYSSDKGMFFRSSQNFIDIQKTVEDFCDKNNISIETFSYGYPIGENILINVLNDDGTTDIYGIRYYPRLEEKDRFWYHYSGMKAYIRCLDSEPKTLLLPYHLITDPRFYYVTAAELNPGTEYEVSNLAQYKEYGSDFCLEEFYDFYCASGWYDVEKQKETLIIHKDGDTFIFRFITHVDLVYFSVDVG